MCEREREREREREMQSRRDEARNSIMNRCFRTGVTKFGPGGPVSLQILAPTLIKHT